MRRLSGEVCVGGMGLLVLSFIDFGRVTSKIKKTRLYTLIRQVDPGFALHHKTECFSLLTSSAPKGSMLSLTCAHPGRNDGSGASCPSPPNILRPAASLENFTHDWFEHNPRPKASARGLHPGKRNPPLGIRLDFPFFSGLKVCPWLFAGKVAIGGSSQLLPGCGYYL